MNYYYSNPNKRHAITLINKFQPVIIVVFECNGLFVGVAFPKLTRDYLIYS